MHKAKQINPWDWTHCRGDRNVNTENICRWLDRTAAHNNFWIAENNLHRTPKIKRIKPIYMQKPEIILFKLAYPCAGILWGALFALRQCAGISNTELLFRWIEISFWHILFRIIFKKLAAIGGPISWKNELKYYLLVNIYWILGSIFIWHRCTQ